MSHELANAIGILSQATGLLGDLMEGCEPGQQVDPDRLRVIRERLDRQTSRASELAQQLNYFAHTLDRHSAEVELNSLARNMVSLSRRLALMKGVELRLECTEEEVRLTADPYGLLQILFLALEYFYESPGNGEEVEITVASTPACIRIESAGVLSRDDDRLTLVQSLAAHTGASVRFETCEQGTVLSFFPAAEPVAGSSAE